MPHTEVGDCRVRSVPARENFDVHMVQGHWVSRFMLASNQHFDTYGLSVTILPSGGLKLFYTPTHDGECTRSFIREIDAPTGGRGVWYFDRDHQQGQSVHIGRSR